MEAAYPASFAVIGADQVHKSGLFKKYDSGISDLIIVKQ
jgi:hypothetical protein